MGKKRKGQGKQQQDTGEEGYGAGPGQFYVEIISGDTADSAPAVVVGTKAERWVPRRVLSATKRARHHSALLPPLAVAAATDAAAAEVSPASPGWPTRPTGTS